MHGMVQDYYLDAACDVAGLASIHMYTSLHLFPGLRFS